LSNLDLAELHLTYQRPKLYPKQLEAMFDPKRISCIEASTKSGKTASGIIWLGEEALKGRPGRNYWWVAPVSLQAKIAFDRMRRAMSQDISQAWLTSPWTIINGAIMFDRMRRALSQEISQAWLTSPWTIILINGAIITLNAIPGHNAGTVAASAAVAAAA
jgi:hypothetical protein